jgi:hypothetical protein
VAVHSVSPVTFLAGEASGAKRKERNKESSPYRVRVTKAKTQQAPTLVPTDKSSAPSQHEPPMESTLGENSPFAAAAVNITLDNDPWKTQSKQVRKCLIDRQALWQAVLVVDEHNTMPFEQLSQRVTLAFDTLRHPERDPSMHEELKELFQLSFEANNDEISATVNALLLMSDP